MPTRRQFVTAAGSFAAAAVFAPDALLRSRAASAAPFRDGSFADGLISGDPATDGITLWTRLDGVSGPGRVELEVARAPSFRQVVARQQIATSGASNHAVKARVSGLAAHEQYWYRFATRNTDSPVGRFRTALPPDSAEPVRFAFFSCQDFTHGYYNAHAVLAAGDYDFVVCLGDYIYAETYHSRKLGTGVRDDRIGRINPRNPRILREAVSLDDYRAKYSLYRSDAALRRVHERFPMVMLWDDHEIVDNYAGGDPRDGGLPPRTRFSAPRRANATRAFFESMPAFPTGRRLYRSLRFGSTVELIVMDQRRYRADQPCLDAVVPQCPGWDAPRAFLGREQMEWVKNTLAASPAAWKVLANEVTMMPTVGPAGLLLGFDNWMGYPREREELLAHIRDHAIGDVVFVTGDLHTFIAGDVRTQHGNGETVAVELVGGSISAQSVGESRFDLGGGRVIPGNDRNPQTPDFVLNLVRRYNPWVDQADLDHHGFGRVTATQQSFDCELVRVRTVKRRSATVLPSDGYRYAIARGQRSIKGVNGPPG